MEQNCPFCFPSQDLIEYENNLVRIIRDAFPVSPGHFLVTPKRHVSDWFAASTVEQNALTAGLSLARDAILRDHQPHGFNIGINIGAAAGQTVPHLHIHLIPRYLGDVVDPTGGVRGVIPDRANYLKPYVPGRTASAQGRLVRGGAEDPLFRHLVSDLDSAASFDLAVAFILPSGVDLLEDHIRDLLQRGGSARVLTGDYQYVTDPVALRRLLDLEGNLELRVFQCHKQSFHPKAYLISGPRGQQFAYVGSSNLSKTALHDGVEWNYRIDADSDPSGIAEIKAAFEDLYSHPDTVTVSDEWLDAYDARRPKTKQEIRIVDAEQEAPAEIPVPHEIQAEALRALEASRAEGNRAGLVVLATGLGKTWLSAFDSSRPEFRRVLFVAHREEILDQSVKTYRRIQPDAHIGKYTGTQRVPNADILFASVQTMSRLPHLRQFDHTHFDYIVIDEFHHAAARTYRKLIDHFAPKFMLGLTATPERTDGGDLLGLCEENLVYRCDIGRGIDLGLLSPFHYFGVPDIVDYANIPWRNSRFDETELTNAVATEARAENALEQLRERGGMRTLGFCCSVRHADYMANFFNERGVRAVAVHSGANSAPRAHSLEKLRDEELDIVFAVDLFNEGVDLPNIDTVLMLRPTESRIVWQQQFGRGLRVAEGKDKLNVIDYIGNHRSFLLKPQTLFDLGSAREDVAEAIRQWQAGTLRLPDGCEVTYDLETIEILEQLTRARGGVAAIQRFYEDFAAMHERRPTALEALHAGIEPNAARAQYGSWLGFLKAVGGLTEGQLRAYERHGDFLENLHKTPMTKSYKMVLLLAMLNRDALPGSIAIDELVPAFRHRAERSQILRGDVGEPLDSDEALRRHLESNPINAWTGGNTGERNPWFSYENGVFATSFVVADEDREPFQELTRELCDWRLGQYLMRNAAAETTANQSFVVKVGSSSGRPILFPLDREKQSGLPYGSVPVKANGEVYEADFVKIAVNVIKRPGTRENVIADILRGWFGQDAGMPGTSHYVVLEQQEDYWVISQQGAQEGAKGPELWKPYLRADIAGLFGEPYKENKWRQGYIKEGRYMFLLVTLDKDGMATDHQYADRFLSPKMFEWQSQNRHARSAASGQEIKNHAAAGLTPVLFVRPRSRVGGRAAPFYYCGELEFESWEGDRPITVRWRLKDTVPTELDERFLIDRET